ncbi:glycosyltransferase family 4 protein [Foetidibacter luteolus]|uniref:glycosyltransferase family 4 protein n=1 Tax=Foetidibacter luteolus TaxID=2608880 RepID=UPI00129AC756|nr:glycosyltransferase family 4 protein [Foetidibacter luteolus]
MKILHVCQNYYPSKGGPQYTLKHLSEKLVEYYGDEVTVCTTDSLYNPESALYKRIVPVRETLNAVKINRLPFRRWHYPLIKYVNKAAIKVTRNALPEHITAMRWDVYSPAIKKMMASTTADVIMGTTINYDFCNYPVWRNAYPNPRPFVIYGSLHLHKSYDYNDTSIKKARLCDCYIANTDYERDVLIHKYGVEPGKIVTIGTGIDVAAMDCREEEVALFRKQHGIADDDIILGFVGRLVKGKGVALLLGLIRNLYKENSKIKLLLAGASTDYVPVIKEAMHKEGLPIILIENFAEGKKPVIYNAMDIFILPSQSESFGVVFLEAWACKKPVVGASMGATASLLNDGTDSFLFDLDNMPELENKINMLAASAELRKVMGENGYKKASRQFSWPSIVEGYRNAYLLGIENFKKQASLNYLSEK